MGKLENLQEAEFRTVVVDPPWQPGAPAMKTADLIARLKRIGRAQMPPSDLAAIFEAATRLATLETEAAAPVQSEAVTWQPHPDQTSPMTVGPEAFLDEPDEVAVALELAIEWLEIDQAAEERGVVSRIRDALAVYRATSPQPVEPALGAGEAPKTMMTEFGIVQITEHPGTGDLADTKRNQIINQASYEISNMISKHDPETDTSLNNQVWDRLAQMASEIEAHKAPGAGEDAERESALVEVAQRILDRGYVSESIEEERGDYLALKEALSHTRQPTEPKPAQGTGETVDAMLKAARLELADMRTWNGPPLESEKRLVAKIAALEDVRAALTEQKG